MAFIELDEQEKIRKDYAKELENSKSSPTQVRKYLAAKYKRSYSTIHKITTVGYKLKQANGQYKKEDVEEAIPAAEIVLPRQYPRTLIFTAWEIRVGVSDAFVDILSQMQKEYNAEVMLTSVWPSDLQFLPPNLSKFKILMSDMKINENLVFKYVPTHALAMSPIAGWSGAHESTVILPGLVKDLVTEKSNNLCKQIISTGSIGKLNAFLSHYSHIEDDDVRTRLVKRWSLVQGRRGGRIYEVAKQFTVPCALVVDVIDSKTFLTRYVTMEKEGTVYDKGLKFTAGKDSPVKSTPKALVVGDQHAYTSDTLSSAASFEMINLLNPDTIILQDFFDGASVNHHEWDDFANVVEFPSIEEEAAITKHLLVKYAEAANKIVYLQSNHDDFLIKYLASENNYKYGTNYVKAIELRLWQLQKKQHPIIKLLELDKIKNLTFSSSRDLLKIAGVNIVHGHEGISGRRVGFRAQQKVYNRMVMGHVHSPEVFRNGAVCGTNSILNPKYTIGASGWMAANTLVQPDGSLQLLPIINGKWKL